MKLAATGRDLLELFLPRGCLGCGDRIPPESGAVLVCCRCLSSLRPPPPPRCPRCGHPLGTGHPDGGPCLECLSWPDCLLSARSAVVMEPPADALVHALKYSGWRSLAGLMGERMARFCDADPDRAIMVPVPTTPFRRRVRGYNQAEVLAEAIAELANLSVVGALRRRAGRTQVRLGPRERVANVRGCFEPVPAHCSRINGREVILIDDVLTTGATALSAIEALEEGGAGSVRLVTFARALPFGAGRRRRYLGA